MSASETDMAISTAAEAERAIANLNTIMDSLIETVEEETAHMRKGRLREAVALEPRKTELVRDGFDPIAVKDELRFDDAASGRFEPLTPALYARIAAQQVRL